MFRLLARLFSRSRKAESPAALPSVSEELDSVLSRSREKIKRLMITRSQGSGLIKKTETWTLHKNNADLFRLELEGGTFLISVRPFVAMKEGKLNGLLHMSEAELCRLVEQESGSESFIRASDPLSPESEHLMQKFFASSGQNASLATGNEFAGESYHPVLGDLGNWHPFDVDQMVVRNNPNILAHVLIHADESTGACLRAHLSRRMQEMIVQEIEMMLRPGVDKRMNPYARILYLEDFEKALAIFLKNMADFEQEEYLRRTRASAGTRDRMGASKRTVDHGAGK